MKAPFQPEALHSLIGRQFVLDGERYTAIEILNQPLALVAQKNQLDPHYQNDAYGRARSQTLTSTLTIPVLTADGSSLHADFLRISGWISA